MVIVTAYVPSKVSTVMVVNSRKCSGERGLFRDKNTLMGLDN